MNKLKRYVANCILLIALIAFPANVFAYGFVGGEGNPSLVYGVTVDITTPNAYPTVTGSEISSAWDMVLEKNTGNLAQVGFAFEPALTQYINPHYFFQYWYNDGADHSEVDSTVGPARGSIHTYKVILESGYWNGYVGDAKIGGTATTINADHVEFYDEVNTTGVKYIGTSTDKLKMNLVKYKNAAGSWVKPTLTFPTVPINASINTANWGLSGYWYSWDTR